METTPTPIYDNLVITQLEEQFEEDAPCEFNHVKTPCSGTVTHRVASCEKSLLICENAAKQKYAQLAIRDKIVMCGNNPHPIQACWIITLV